ncbi:polyprenyl synthetase family protein [Thiohalorhabdus methylotrophus]|uniref:Polyprenyl synthetase family protein n=1 Tax=Thiohalorhabdus methylotrophus TaxID=3242694 RepID=A0ABV4TX37_9GAMM
MEPRLESFIKDRRSRVEQTLEVLLPEADALSPAPLGAALRYAVLGSGKRMRPILVLAGCEAVGGDPDGALAPAAAVECIHAYSLVHDDLPALDNDDLRRGQPTTHKAYDEATAVLVGDALQTLAFQAIADADTLPVPVRLAMTRRLAHAAGHAGMVGGQALDLAQEDREIGMEALQRIHRLKTGALLRTSVELGALAGTADTESVDRLGAYGRHIGLAFQITDDVLDVEGDTEALGKTAGADAEHHKATYPALLGLEESKRLARQEVDQALEWLTPFGEAAEPLRALARYIIDRDH